MAHFLREVLLDLNQNKVSLENLTFILPNKRAGVFLKQELALLLDRPIFSPDILSIEEFVQELSGLQLLAEPELIFKLYSAYLEHTPNDEQEPFESFFVWAKVLLQDFNEIDRYLIDHDMVFDYLQAIKDIDHWSLQKENSTNLIKSHLKFWKRLKPIYHSFVQSLLTEDKGFQGLVYREAHANLEHYIDNHQSRIHVFLGFNALNSSESEIIQALLANDMASIYWDIDAVFMKNKNHSAGEFLRGHKAKWNHYKTKDFKWVSNYYSEEKFIKVVGVPKKIGQAKYIGQILKSLTDKHGSLQNIAVVLGDEQLLMPVLSALPDSISSVNVTMGLPLRYIPLVNFFNSLFKIHRQTPKTFYYKDLMSILTLPSANTLYRKGTVNYSNRLIEHIQKNNLVYLTDRDIYDIIPECKPITNLLFGNWHNDPQIALKNCKTLLLKLKEQTNPKKDSLKLEYLYRINTLLNRMDDLIHGQNYVENISSLFLIFKNILDMETIDFKGEPLEGLQIMGMLETRVLDFETVIISSLNEGILPGGKSPSTFIPFEIKKDHGLPTFKEKDAVYTYHFYRLLQRAKKVILLYNTEIDVLKGGEKSRFISQLEVEGIHSIEHIEAQPILPSTASRLRCVKKTSDVLTLIQSLSQKGFSPSSLTSYIRNPLDFYYEKLLGVKEYEDVEERLAANTMGTVIHNTLEQLYKPYEGQYLTTNILNSFKPQIRPIVRQQFRQVYGEGNISSGKNLLVFEVIIQYITKFINLEIRSIEDGNTIKIQSIESEESRSFHVPGINAAVVLKGKIDRIDEFNGSMRLIDYKSGKVEPSEVQIKDWGELITNYKGYGKSFQLLCYTYMLAHQKKFNFPLTAGIYSFKNLNLGFLSFMEINTEVKTKKLTTIDKETINKFEIQLHTLILELFDPNIDFLEKETD